MAGSSTALRPLRDAATLGGLHLELAQIEAGLDDLLIRHPEFADSAELRAKRTRLLRERHQFGELG